MLPETTNVAKSGNPPENLGVHGPFIQPDRKHGREPMAKKCLSDIVDAIFNGVVKMEPEGWLGPLENFDQAEVAEDSRVFVHLQQVYYIRGTSMPHAMVTGRFLTLLGEAADAIGGTITHVY